jgi:hypothetical protein
LLKNVFPYFVSFFLFGSWFAGFVVLNALQDWQSGSVHSNVQKHEIILALESISKSFNRLMLRKMMNVCERAYNIIVN